MRDKSDRYPLALGSFFVVVLLALISLLTFGRAALAQGGADLPGEPIPPRPAEVEGDANWTIGELTYQAEFPEGITFGIEAESDAGAIVSARVVWMHAPGSGFQRSRGAHLDGESGRWVATWEPVGGDVPPWVLVRYHWELTDDQGNRYFTEERDEIYPDGDNADYWRHLESEDAVVYWFDLPDEYGQLVIEAMAARREFYRLAWGGSLPFRPRIILYGPDALAQYELALGRPAVVGGGIVAGTTSEDWGGTVQYMLPRYTPQLLAYGLVLHEMAHIYQNQFAHLPADWFVEGNAEFFAIERAGDYRQYAFERLSSGDPLSFAGGFSTRGTTFRDGYEIGATIFDYLVETYGLEAHRQMWELIADNVPQFEAIERVTGVSIEQFERDWRRWLGITTPPPTLIPSPTPLVDIFTMPTPTPMSFGG